MIMVFLSEETVMDESLDFDEASPRSLGNWSQDYLNDLDTSQYPFPNALWHVKSPKEIAIKTTLMLIIAVPGIYMNFVILVVLIKNKWLWSPSIFLIGNLALVDFLTLLICPWFMLVREFFQNYVLKTFGCKFEGFLQGIFLLSNVLAVVLVAYDRLAAAVLPTEARITKSVAPKLIAVAWGIAAVFSLPWIINRYYEERQWKDFLETYCVEEKEVLDVYWHFIILLLVWVPLGVMTVTYVSILWRLERSSRRLSSRGGGQLVARAKARTMRVAAGVLFADCICRIPYSATIYIRNQSNFEINWVDGGYSVLWFAANALIYTNCSVNPLIYGFTNIRILKAMDMTPGVAFCKFGSWCCVCASNSKKELRLQQDKNTEKIFVIETTPSPKRKLTKIIKNLLHINADAIDLSVQKLDEVTTKPTKVTPLKPEPELNHFSDKININNFDERDNDCYYNQEGDKL